jgi:CubicO group peptidase (beta-lactamase class C family)
MDMEAKKAMQTGTLFRLASMTKPLTAVSILMLMEENKLILADPVSKFIPEFANGKVAEWNLPNDTRGAGVRLVPVNREMTLQDILTHTAGMTVANEGPAGESFARLKIAPGATLADRVGLGCGAATSPAPSGSTPAAPASTRWGASSRS